MKILKKSGRLVKHAGRLVKTAAAAVASCLCCGPVACPDCATENVCVDFTVPLNVLTNQCCYFATNTVFGDRIFMKVHAFPSVLEQRVCPGMVWNGTEWVTGNSCIFRRTLFHPDYANTPATLRDDQGLFDPAVYDVRLYRDGTCTNAYRYYPDEPPYSPTSANDHKLVIIEFVFDAWTGASDAPVGVILYFDAMNGIGQPYTLNLFWCYEGSSAFPYVTAGYGDTRDDWTYNEGTCCWARTFNFAGCPDQEQVFDDSYYDEPCVWNEETEEYVCTYYEDIKTYCVFPIRPDGVASVCLVAAEEI